jgi:hypothetical protein
MIELKASVLSEKGICMKPIAIHNGNAWECWLLIVIHIFSVITERTPPCSHLFQ